MKQIKAPEKKTYERSAELTRSVLDIIEKVRKEGDAALIELTGKFDGIKISSVRITKSEIEAAYKQVDQETVDAIRFAAGQIRYFAEKQLECLSDLKVEGRVPGLELGHRMLPVRRCGCYVPAGRHPLPSSALMGIIPAKVAGVREICACSPAYHGFGTIHPAVLVAMDIAGADEIYCMGGAQAIAAYTYGTESIQPVDLIVGPGNQYVTEAKRQVMGDVGIDSLAGPSEVLILADHTADPEFVAIDLLAQAEHDPNSKAVLISTSMSLIEGAMKELERLLPTLATKDVAGIAWENNGEVYLADNMEEAIDFCNYQAPEHLEVQTENEREVADKLENYGSLFVGDYAPVPLGDFVSGTNHTLPTMRTARFSSGVWVGTYIKTPFQQFVTKEGMEALAEACMKFAEVEGLQGHRDTIRLRLARG